jgi:hypothetical protein
MAIGYDSRVSLTQLSGEVTMLSRDVGLDLDLTAMEDVALIILAVDAQLRRPETF